MRNILLVEDNIADAELLAALLAEVEDLEPYRIEHVQDGVDALAYLRGEGAYAEAPRPDLLILDLRMPKVSGLELLRSIREMPPFEHLPVVVLSTSDHERDLQEARRLGADAYFLKRVDLASTAEVAERIGRSWMASDDRRRPGTDRGELGGPQEREGQ